ncbi:MAG: glycosyltransferase, partial [Candidatus Dormiibacterota bacterium]
MLASLVTPLRAAPEGGAQTFLVNLARALHSRGHDVVLYAAEGSVVPGLRVRALPAPPGVEAALWRHGAGGTPASSRVAGLGHAFAAAYAAMREDQREVVSQHAFDAEAIELAG